MKTDNSGIDSQVKQLDNDVQSIYVMLAGIQGTQERHTNRLNELAIRLDAVNDVIGMRISNAVDRLAERDEAIEQRLDRVECRLDKLLDLLRS